MIRELNHDPMSLATKSVPATKEDAPVAKDLFDTLAANLLTCVGMAANMIGEHKCIIAFVDSGHIRLMYNPTILDKVGGYKTEEGCLSYLGGPRPTTRYKNIRVKYQDENFRTKTESFSGFTAQIIQHEVDHCNGILI